MIVSIRTENELAFIDKRTFLIISLEKIEKRYFHLHISEFSNIWIWLYSVVTFVISKEVHDCNS